LFETRENAIQGGWIKGMLISGSFLKIEEGPNAVPSSSRQAKEELIGV